MRALLLRSLLQGSHQWIAIFASPCHDGGQCGIIVFDRGVAQWGFPTLTTMPIPVHTVCKTGIVCAVSATFGQHATSAPAQRHG